MIIVNKEKRIREKVNLMDIYFLLRFQEQMYYASVVAEVTNIFYYICTVFNITLPYGFYIAMSIFNLAYGFYMVFIIAFTRGEFRRSGFIIIALAILKELLWKSNPIISIIDSIMCLGVLIVYHRFIYGAISEIDRQIEEQIERIEKKDNER